MGQANFGCVPVFGMPRKLNFKACKVDDFIFISIIKCFLLYFEIQFPDVVFAAGGYVSAPMVIIAKIFKIPYAMHDSDAHPGIVTRAFSSCADYVNLAFCRREQIY